MSRAGGLLYIRHPATMLLFVEVHASPSDIGAHSDPAALAGELSPDRSVGSAATCVMSARCGTTTPPSMTVGKVSPPVRDVVGSRGGSLMVVSVSIATMAFADTV